MDKIILGLLAQLHEDKIISDLEYKNAIKSYFALKHTSK